MNDKVLQNIDISSFQDDLIDWYQRNKRDLPWRESQDPYRVWVSEIMLQQTKVDTVIPYFKRFVDKYPTLTNLANANEQDVLKMWEGLGYYSRARNLQNAVREVVAEYNGEIPANEKELGALKGVGPYTKGAILSIAFNQPVPAVDGNVMRVLSRVLKIEDDIAQSKVKNKFESYVNELISTEDPSSFNQGIMELGALICTPKTPMCMLCPVHEHCTAFAEGIEEDLPIKSKAKKQKKIPYVVLLIRNKDNQYVIEKRPDGGLLANLYQFPMVPAAEIGMDHIESWIKMEYGITIRLKDKKGKLKHVFSHIIWQLEIFEAVTEASIVDDERIRLVDHDKFSDYPFPVSHQKMMKYVREE